MENKTLSRQRKKNSHNVFVIIVIHKLKIKLFIVAVWIGAYFHELLLLQNFAVELQFLFLGSQWSAMSHWMSVIFAFFSRTPLGISSGREFFVKCLPLLKRDFGSPLSKLKNGSPCTRHDFWFAVFVKIIFLDF